MIDFNTELGQTFPIGKSVDVFGDQTLWAISTPGHSKGHISYLVNSKDGPVFITGNACILNKSLETGVGPGTSSFDIAAAQKTLDKICAFVRGNPAVKVWCGHDFPQ
jgi:glyoxylase-like metal-dependent hydrolase (beta-lactamase superfamily II)